MPRVAPFRIEAVARLYRQLSYAPAEKRIVQMNAAEALIADIEPGQNYPEDFVVYRVTGYRPRGNDAATLVGEALVGDLINLVQRLSEGLALPAGFEGRSPMTIEEAADRLSISTKTVQRYRRRGLVCHYVVYEAGEKRLVCFEDAIERFMTRHGGRVERARRFSRVDDQVVRGMIDAAATLRAEEGLSLNEAAARIAGEFGRARETVRLILKRHDRRAERAIFAERGPLTARDLRVLFRAWRFGVAVADLGRRFSRGAPAIHGAVNRRRAELLRGLALAWIELPTFNLDDAADVLLKAPAVRTGGRPILPDDDALLMIDEASGSGAVDDRTLDSLVAAYNFLKMRAAAAIAALRDAPASAALDEIETDLRWAGRLKQRLVSAALPAALRVIEQTLHRALPEHPAEEIVRLLELAVEVASRSVEKHDPTRKGERLERVCAYAMGRAMAALYGSAATGRASARHAARPIALSHPLGRICPWQSWLEVRRDMAAAALAIDEDDRRLFQERYGLAGGPPHTLVRLASMRGMSVQRCTKRLIAIERKLRHAAREHD